MRQEEREREQYVKVRENMIGYSTASTQDACDYSEQVPKGARSVFLSTA